ncbi:MAG: gliding motility-associated C-terminal domain-containing protein [Bacteroidetes bacterium]|nr:gliding motility-associated C-terminal domain-containing protein [Bacteroidota bacterium]
MCGNITSIPVKDSVTLVSDSALTYLWSDGSTGQSITVSGTGQYLVTVLDLNGCPAISSIVTTYQQQQPDLQVHTDSILVCSVGMNFEFTNISNFEPGSQWLWDFGDGNYSNETSPEHIYDTPGQYLVTYQCISPIGCNGSDSIPVTVQFEPLATADFTINTEVNHIFGIPFQFTDASINATSWNWEFGDGGVGTGQLETHRYSEIKQYFVTLTVTNTDGCESDTTKPLFVSPVYVPNAFTPDGDGKNDTFYDVGYGTGPFQMDVDCYEMLIFNRWGQLVYRTNSPNRPWDGTMSNGKPAPLGVYLYKILIEIKADNEVNHVKETFVGTVTLLR